jgi:serine/threonine-protein kinase
MMTTDENAETAEIAERRVGCVLSGKWRLERVLGAGGMATVYAASHVNNGRAAAIKLLHPELAANADMRKRFAREGYIANKVGHPAAVAVLDDGVDDDDGSVYLVMDLLEGQSLNERARSAPGGVLRESDVLFIADGVLDVLAAAHAEGIIHRDLKPDNVFVTAEGVVRVLDFGIARLVDRPNLEQATKTGLVIGTPAYMPPEQARGRSKLVDARSDLWSLGAILFTLLTARHVHDGETPSEALLKAMTAHAPPLASVVPDVSPAVAALVDRALAYEPNERWPDARAMQDAVRDARAKAATGARDVLRRRRRRSGVVFVALAIGGFALATSLFAPAQLRRVGDAVTAMTPAVTTEADAGTIAVSDAAIPRAARAQPAFHPAPSTRPKVPPRPHGAR